MAPPASRTIDAGTWMESGSMSELPAAFHRLVHGDVVGVLEVAADGHAHGDARHAHPQRLEQPREVEGGGLPFDVRVGREDHLVGAARVDAAEEALDAQLVGP